MQTLVLDTNIVLDLFVFADTAAEPLARALDTGRHWVATPPMREELARVLAYPQIATRMAFHERNAQHVLGRFDAHARMVDVPTKVPVNCKDPDDQKFVDLAVAHGALLLSKDGAVLALRKRLAARGVTVARALVV